MEKHENYWECKIMEVLAFHPPVIRDAYAGALTAAA